MATVLLQSHDRTKMERNEEEDQEPLIGDKVQKPKGFPQSRHVLAFLAFLGFVNVYALRVNLSVAIVSMVKPSNHSNYTVSDECPGDISNSTHNSTHNSTNKQGDHGGFDWDSNLQGLVLGSFFYGYIFTQIPGGWLAERYGGKKLFGFGVLCTSVLTILTPMAAHKNVYLFIVLRILEGLGEGVTFPAMHAMLSKWAPPLERSKLGTFIYAGAQFGTVVSLPVSGLLCGSSLGWESVFYLFGGLGCVWFGFWMIFVFDTPAQHPRISEEEKQYIETAIGPSQRKHLPVPLLAIVTSLPFWAMLNAHVCNNWGFYTLLTCLPTYMKEILHFDISQNGMLSALPYLVMWILINVGGQLADFLRYKHIMSTTNVRKMMNGLGLSIPAGFLILLSYLGCARTLAIAVITAALGIQGLTMAGFGVNHIDLAPRFAGFTLPAIFLVITGYVGCDQVIAVLMVTFAVGFGGFALSGYQVNHIDIAPPFAGTLLGMTNAAATIPGFVGPQVVGILTQTPSIANWRKVFFISAGIYIFGAVVYLIFGSGVEQPWARVEHFEAQEEKKRKRKQEVEDREVLNFAGDSNDDQHIQHH